MKIISAKFWYFFVKTTFLNMLFMTENTIERALANTIWRNQHCSRKTVGHIYIHKCADAVFLAKICIEEKMIFQLKDRFIDQSGFTFYRIDNVRFQKLKNVVNFLAYELKGLKRKIQQENWPLNHHLGKMCCLKLHFDFQILNKYFRK